MKSMVRALVLVSVMSPGFTFAATASSAQKHDRAREKKAFRRGVCVGQNLAAAGVDVEATDLKNLTDEQKAVFKAAIDNCKEKQSAESKQAPSESSSTDQSGT